MHPSLMAIQLGLNADWVSCEFSYQQAPLVVEAKCSSNAVVIKGCEVKGVSK